MNSIKRPTALIAEDEPLLREELIHMLRITWPELDIIATVRNGKEAIAQFELFNPDICFLDVHMPVFSGIEVARQIGTRSHFVFVTAFDHYAVQAFEQGAIDYLIKPIEMNRLHHTISRLKHHLTLSSSLQQTEQLNKLENILSNLNNQFVSTPQIQTDINNVPTIELQTINSDVKQVEKLHWIKAQVGQVLKFIAVRNIDFLKADDKYTLVGWHNESNQAVEDLIRTPLKELILQLNDQHFIQVHRAAVVNLNSIKHVVRGDNETATIYLKGHVNTLPVSRTYLHHFRQM